MDVHQDRMSWAEIRHCDSYRGRWVALDDWEVDEVTGQAKDGSVVDADDDLVVLCERLRDRDQSHCQIVFCREALDESDELEPALHG